MIDVLSRTVSQAGYTVTYFYKLLAHWNVEEHRVKIGAADDATQIVLLIPGLFATGGVMSVLQRWLRRKGLPAFVAETGFYSAISLEKATRIVIEEIRAIRERYPHVKRIDLVGHSLGGILAYFAAEAGALDGLEDSRIVTLGAPFDGTWMAALSFAAPAVFFTVAPVTPTLIPPLQRRRWRTRAYGARVRLSTLSIAGELDVIVPPARCRIEGARNVILADVDHAGLVLKKRVFWEIHRYLLADIVERKTIRPLAA